MFCLIHRWKIDRALDDNQELPRSTKTHIANCPNCRDHYQQQAKLIEQLEQPSPTPEAPPFLRARIINALQSAEPRTEPTLSVPVWVPIAACAVIAFFLYPRTASLPSPLDPPIAAVKQPALPSVNLPEVNVTKALEVAHNTLANPYDQEMKNLQEDLQAAGAYLGRLVPVRVAIND